MKRIIPLILLSLLFTTSGLKAQLLKAYYTTNDTLPCTLSNTTVFYNDSSYGNIPPFTFQWVVTEIVGTTLDTLANYGPSTAFNYYSYTYTVGGTYSVTEVVSSGTDTSKYTRVFQIAPNLSVTHVPFICNGGSATITATGANSYLWLPLVGLNTSVGATVIASPINTTTYTVTGLGSNGCTASLPVLVIVDTPLHISVTGKSNVCIGLKDTLVASGMQGVYYWHGGFGSVYNGDTSIETYNFTQVDTVVCTDGLGCKALATFLVTVQPLPSITYTADSPAYVCTGIPKQLQVFVNNTTANSFEWQPKFVGALSCYNCSNPITSINTDIVYTIVATSIYGCIDSIAMPVTVYYNWPTSVRPDTIICFGDSARLFATGGISYVWNPTSSLTVQDSWYPYAKPDVTTEYYVTITENVCFTYIDSVNVRVVQTPILNISGKNQVIAGDETILTASCSNDTITTWLWTAPDDTTILSPNSAITAVVPTVSATVYTVTASTIQGCHNFATFTVNILCENSQVFIPNTFTPNGDGQNDRFYLSGRGLGLVKHMAIYNRWGQLLYEVNDVNANDASFGWDGTYKGLVLEPDVFIYVIDVFCEQGNVPFHFTGDVTLMR